MTEIRDKADVIRREISRVIVGQDDTVDCLLMALLAGGHLLLEGVPGLAKTLMVKTLALTLNVPYKRIQFTPDLMPSDVVGTNIYNIRDGSFSLRRGPVFTGLLLADEINRTPPKTQAALLEAMQERQVTIDGEMYPLPKVFVVCATQNPIEYEGTYPLPEAQLDRFLLKAVMPYPTAEEEVEILKRQPHDFGGAEQAGVTAVADPQEILAMRAKVREVLIEDKIYEYVAAVARTTRDAPNVMLGASPRAAQAVLLCARVAAAMQGRGFVTPDDIKKVAYPALRHRLLLRPDAEMEGATPDHVISEVLARVPVPR